jgi:hypothetical protein
MSTVTESALIRRINRVLAKKYQAVRRFRVNAQGFDYHGRFYVLDTWRNSPIDTHVDLTVLARMLGVLGFSEVLA